MEESDADLLAVSHRYVPRRATGKDQSVVDREPIVAVAFLTESNLRAVGQSLQRIYPIDHSPGFEQLLAQIDEAERKLRDERH
jgi:hypothetical protein